MADITADVDVIANRLGHAPECSTHEDAQHMTCNCGQADDVLAVLELLPNLMGHPGMSGHAFRYRIGVDKGCCPLCSAACDVCHGAGNPCGECDPFGIEPRAWKFVCPYCRWHTDTPETEGHVCPGDNAGWSPALENHDPRR